MKDWFLLTIMVVMLTGWLVGCTATSSSEVVIEYRRNGGFAGLDDHLIITKSGEATLIRTSERSEFILTSDTLHHLQTLCEGANVSHLRTEYLPSRPGSDLVTYIVTYNGHAIRTMDGAVPPSLQPILEALNHIIERQGT